MVLSHEVYYLAYKSQHTICVITSYSIHYTKLYEKMGYIFEELISKFSENAEAGDHYTGRDIIKCMVNILLAEGCDA